MSDEFDHWSMRGLFCYAMELTETVRLTIREYNDDLDTDMVDRSPGHAQLLVQAQIVATLSQTIATLAALKERYEHE